MKKEMRITIAGLIAIIGAALLAFTGLYRFMDGQTRRDVKKIAGVFLEEETLQEENRFEVIKTIRFTQLESMVESVGQYQEEMSPAATREILSRGADFQNLANCSLIGRDGTIERVYGDEIKVLGDEEFLIGSLLEGNKRIVTGGWSDLDQLIIFASPVCLPMEGGQESVGLLWCKPVSLFSHMMNLENGDSMVYFQLLRRDFSYVLNPDERWGNSFDQLVTQRVIPEELSKKEFLEVFQGAMEEGDHFTCHIRFQEEGSISRRSVYALPLQDTNWYLVAVIPYGVLDETISAMGSARLGGMMAGFGFLLLVLLVVFGIYLTMMKQQITQSERARETAEAAREDAEYANKAKSEFLSNMSHDIRTPMNAIVGMTKIARDHIEDPERVKDCLKKITLSGKQLLGLINDVLDMSKIESGKMTLNPEALSLKQTMETMCDIVRPQIKANGQSFDIFISDILCEEVYCDSVRINQVLLNFLSNAMKFTPEGGYIHIHLWQEPSPRGEGYVRTHFLVKDSGMGMTREFQEKLFTAFEREDTRRVHKTQGTGLGLAITKYIVEAMEGSIAVDSQVGEGTAFHVTVDLERVSEEQAQMSLPPWRILVVDDNEELCQSAASTLRELGTSPSICQSGEEALLMAQKAHQEGEDFFAALVDYKMEGMNGIETSYRLREVLDGRTPICLISAYDWTEIEEEARAAQVSRFIPKPLFKSTLYHELRLLETGGESLEEGEESAGPPLNLTGKVLLLAEDNDINAEIATVILEESGARVERAEDGRIATEMFEASPAGYYCAILMDLRMPHRNGIEATQIIRDMKRADAASIPIIAMTADAFAEDAQKCIAAGMNTHLAKPIDVDQLRRTLMKYIRTD